jgi:glycerate kinase
LSGCGGGLSGGLWAAHDAELVHCAALVLDELGLNRFLQRAELVITGEGRLDSQTAGGKLAAEIARRASAAGTRCVAIVGRNDLREEEARLLGLERVIEAGDEEALIDAAWRLNNVGSSAFSAG